MATTTVFVAKATCMAIVYLLLITTITMVASQATTAIAPSPGPDCFSSLADMADCLSYVDDGSKFEKPDPQCCPEVSDLMGKQPACLCKFLANSSQFGLTGIDTKRDFKLPTLCNLSTSLSPVQLCAVIGVSVPDLAPSPLPSDKKNGSPTGKIWHHHEHLSIMGLLIVLLIS